MAARGKKAAPRACDVFAYVYVYTRLRTDINQTAALNRGRHLIITKSIVYRIGHLAA